MAAARPLVMTDDPELLDELLRIAETAGVEVDVAAAGEDLVSRWQSAPLVLVGWDRSGPTARLGLEPRQDVVLVCWQPSELVWREAVSLGAAHVVTLPDGESWIRTEMCLTVDAVPTGAVLAVVGGRGGAGATSFAVAAGLAAARDKMSALLVDADPMGGGLDLALGAEETSGLRWEDLAGCSGDLDGAALLASLPEIRGLRVLSCSRSGPLAIPAEAMRSVLEAAREVADLVVVDLPRSFDDAARRALGLATTAALIVPAEVRACAAAGRVAAAIAPWCSDLRLVVRGPAPTGLSADAVARALGLPLQVVLRPEPGLAPALDRGEPPGRRPRGPLAEAVANLVDEVVARAWRMAS